MINMTYSCPTEFQDYFCAISAVASSQGSRTRISEKAIVTETLGFLPVSVIVGVKLILSMKQLTLVLIVLVEICVRGFWIFLLKYHHDFLGICVAY